MRDNDFMIDPTTLTNVCGEFNKSTEIDKIRCAIMEIVNADNDLNIGIDKLTELGCKVEDYPVETGQRGMLWRVRSQYCIQLTDGRDSPRHAYCVLIQISDIQKMIRKMKLSKLSGKD
jgi:hypothetical protein